MPATKTPPKAQLAFRVGIVGHRPDRLQHADLPCLKARLHEVLAAVKESVDDFANADRKQDPAKQLYLAEDHCLRGITSLAEGADRYFARAALGLNYDLCCPLPFPKHEYERDFAPGRSEESEPEKSVADFNDILNQAAHKTVFELDGSRAAASDAYRAAARVVLNQSDLLVVVWDGGHEIKVGGTFETLKEALAFEIPVLWIDARAPHAWQVLRKEKEAVFSPHQRSVPQPLGGARLSDEINEVVNQVLGPPHPVRHPRGKRDLREKYFSHPKPSRNFYRAWKIFRDYFDTLPPVVSLLKHLDFSVPEFEAAVARDWPIHRKGVAGWVNQQLARHFAWADQLADFYADVYRSSFVIYSILGALAVMLALIPASLGNDSGTLAVSCASLELVCIGFAFLLFSIGRKQRWHEQWMEFRLMAELIRQSRFLIPLGGGRPLPHGPQPIEGYESPAHSWIYWHLRAVNRQMGLPRVKTDPEYLRECLHYVGAAIKEQREFHRATADRNMRIEKRLRKLEVAFLLAVGILPALHLFLLVSDYRLPLIGERIGQLNGWSFVGAFLPAVGGALAAISNQAELVRIAKRSHAMAYKLSQLDQEIHHLLKSEIPLHSRETIEVAMRTAQIMVEEVMDWRVIFLDRPLVPPA